MRVTTRKAAHQARRKRRAPGEDTLQQQCCVAKGGRRCPRLFVPGKSGAKGMCSMHYARARKNAGDPGDPEPEKSGDRKVVQVKFWTTPENEGRFQAAAYKAGKKLSPWCEEQLLAAIS